ncbi:hypothetical protein [Bremerella sp.]|uniref:hypothetical protein n=1 Tax=Bremerella sp. TaxID=2795602 RepID=UPI00391B04E0
MAQSESTNSQPHDQSQVLVQPLLELPGGGSLGGSDVDVLGKLRLSEVDRLSKPESLREVLRESLMLWDSLVLAEPLALSDALKLRDSLVLGGCESLSELLADSDRLSDPESDWLVEPESLSELADPLAEPEPLPESDSLAELPDPLWLELALPSE